MQRWSEPAGRRVVPRAPMRVLIVDDHALWRSIVRRTIDCAEIDVVGDVGSAEEALAIAPALEPDVILLDSTLPGLSGSDAVRELVPRLPNARIVMFSGHAEEREIFDALANGAFGYLTKDLAPDALLRAVLGVRDGDLPMSRRAAATVMRQFVGLARRGHGGVANVGGVALTQRESDILARLSVGMTNQEIADELTLSVRTVESHVAHVLRKLGVRNRAEAGRLYMARHSQVTRDVQGSDTPRS